MRQKALIFLSFYILALLAPMVTMIDFALNQEKIADKFCENKAVPELQCEGKCHLSKMLAEQTQSDDEELSSNGSIEYPIGKIETLSVKGVLFQNVKLNYPSINTGVLSPYLIQIDQPPQV